MRLSACSALAMLFMGTAAVVDAALIAFTQPVDPSASVNAGSPLLIRWTFDTNVTSPDPNVVTGVLRLGKSNSKDIVEIQPTEIANLNNAALKLKEYSWTVPSTLATSNQYSIILDAGGTSYYSGKFSIINSAVPSTNTTGTDTGKGSGAIKSSTIFLSTVPAIVVAAVSQPFL